MYQDIYNCICQNTTKIKYIIHYVKPTAQLLFKIRFPKGGPTCRRQMVNPRHQQPQLQSLKLPCRISKLSKICKFIREKLKLNSKYRGPYICYDSAEGKYANLSVRNCNWIQNTSYICIGLPCFKDSYNCHDTRKKQYSSCYVAPTPLQPS